MILKNTDLEIEGCSPPAIFTGPEALKTPEHRWHMVAFLI